MKRFFISLFFVALVVFTAPLSAQTGGIGTGGIGTGGIGTGTGGSSSSSSSSSSSGSQLGEDVSVPEFQGFDDISGQSFIGRQESGSPFIGREEFFNSSTTRGSSRTTASTTSNRRTTTTRRATASRSAGASRSGSTSGGREVRAETATDFAFSPMEVGGRETAFRSRLGRLPNFRAVPEQVEIKLAQTPAGTVATLTGKVSTERDRRLVKQLVLLEPGIDAVENNLVVAEDPAEKMKSLPNLDPGATP